MSETVPTKLTEEEMALHAQQILDNPIFGLVFKSIKTDLLSQWETTEYGQSVLRETLWNQVQAVEYVNQKLKGCINAYLLKKKESMNIV